MSSGASVGSIYSQMILDTSQYEQALREIVGMTKKGSDSTKSSFDKSSESVDKNTRKFKDNKKSVDSLSTSIQALGGILGSTAILGGLKSITMEAAKIETVNTSFKVMLGSAEKAKSVLQDLSKFSIDTPFTPTQVYQAGKAMTAFGIEAKNLIPTLQKVGDIASGTGKDFNELSVIYGKAFIAGNIYAEDLNQLMEAGVPIIAELSKVLGVQENQVKKLASEGKIGFAEMDKAFDNMTQSGGRFAGMMDEQAKTIEGSISTMEGNLTGVSVVIGEQLLPIAKSLVQTVSAIAESIGEFAKANPVLFKTIVRLTGALALLVALLIGGAGLRLAIIQLLPLLNTLGITAVTTGGKIAFAFGPAGAAFIAIGLIIALISKTQDRLNRLNAKSVENVTSKLKGLNEQQLSNAKGVLMTMNKADKAVTSNSNEYKNLNSILKSVGLSINDISRQQDKIKKGKDKGKIRFKINVEGVRNQIAAINQMIEEVKNNNPIVVGGVSPEPDTKGKKTEFAGIDGSYNKRLIEIQANLDKATEKRDKFTEYGSEAWSNANDDVSKYNTELESLNGNINTGMFEPMVKGLEKLGVSFNNASKVGMSMVSSLAEGYMNFLSTMAQASAQKFQNVQQQIAGVSDWGQKILDKQIEATIESYDREVQALQEQKDRLIAIEEEYQQKRDEIRNQEIDNIKAKIEAEYQMEAEKTQLAYENDLLKQETDMESEEQRKVNQQRLEEEHLQYLQDLRGRYDDMTQAEIEAMTQKMGEEDSIRSTNSKAEMDAIAIKEKQIEADKIASKEANDKKKADLEKKLKLFEWAMGRQSFEASKRLQMATIQMQMAQGLISAVTAGAMLAATVPVVGGILGPALGLMLSGMVLSAGMSSLQAVSSSQYQPPPAAAFAEGGMITGGVPNMDSVNVRMMPGELVVPTKNFEEVVGAVRNDRQGGSIVISGNNFYGIDSPESFVEQVSDKIFEKTRGAVSAFI